MAEKVMVVGSGGREYELGRQLAGSPRTQELYFAPGNVGTEQLAKAHNTPVKSPEEIVNFATQRGVGAVIIGPEAPLAIGLADELRGAGIAVFGPSRAAAQLEASKAFAAEFMQRNSIPQPDLLVARSLTEALEYIRDKEAGSYVLKADGLAGGKGVVLPDSTKEADEVLRAMFSGKAYDGAGKEGVVIQERLHGPEVSAFAVSDGEDFVLLPLSQDHKRLLSGDNGPNTGGMGAYAPLPKTIVSDVQVEKIKTIIQQTIAGMKREGVPYQGLLYVGLMLAKEREGDPVVIEYNVRFGDPETQVVLPALSEAEYDVAELLFAAAEGGIKNKLLPKQFGKTVLTVCLAASGYPESPRKGDVVYGLDRTYEGVIVHHAGTRRDGERIVTSGGRVLYVSGVGDTADQAAERAYAAIGENGIHFDGMQYRTDIGHQVRKKNR